MDRLVSAALLALAVAVFGAYAIARARAATALGRDVAPSRTGLLPRAIVDIGYWAFAWPVRAFVRLGVSPDALSAASVPPSIAAAALFATGWFGWGALGLVVALALDACDGLLAREAGVASAAGEYVDALADRYNDLLLLLGLLYFYRNDVIGFVVTGSALLGTALVSYTRAKGEALGVDADLGWMQRQERGFCLAVAATLAALVGRHQIVLAGLAVVALGTNATVIARSRFITFRLRGDVGARKR